MKRGWLWGIVLVSLALNLFLGGLVAGRWLGGGHPHGGFRSANPTDIVMPFNPRHFIRSLPDERRKEIIKLLKGRTGDVRRAFQAVGEQRMEIIAALEAEPFDAARLDAAFTDTRGRFDVAVGTIHGVILSLVADLTPDERKLMADAIRDKAAKRAERRAKRRQKWKDKNRD